MVSHLKVIYHYSIYLYLDIIVYNYRDFQIL
jgi:hypothetical protein